MLASAYAGRFAEVASRQQLVLWLNALWKWFHAMCILALISDVAAVGVLAG